MVALALFGFSACNVVEGPGPAPVTTQSISVASPDAGHERSGEDPREMGAPEALPEVSRPAEQVPVGSAAAATPGSGAGSGRFGLFDSSDGGGASSAAVEAAKDAVAIPGDRGGRDAGAPSVGSIETSAMQAAPESGSSPLGSVGCGRLDFPQSGEQVVDVGGHGRRFVVELPQGYDPAQPYRLVFAWHSLGGTAVEVARHWYGLSEHAAGRAIFIAGQARSRRNWRRGQSSWGFAPDDSDVAYAHAMLQWAKASYCVDTERVFSFGDGNGGTMSNIVGCELGGELRAIGVSAGAGPETVATMPCTGQAAVWIAHGNRDDRVPYRYGQNSRDFWLRYHRCSQDAHSVEPDPCVEYQECEVGYPVRFCSFDDGHVIPGFVAEAVWKFFEQF